MTLSRRSFLLGASATTLAALAGPRLAAARGLLTEPALDDLIQRALAAATKAGATYADVRIVRIRSERVATREDRVEGVASSEDYGVGVRVLAGGAWGFAATPNVVAADAERIARAAVAIAQANARLMKRPVKLAPEPVHVDVWQTALVKDPFKIPLEDKAELLLAISREAMKVPGVKFVQAEYNGLSEWKLLATTEGAYIEQEIVRVHPGYTVTAVDDKRGGFESRDHDLPPRQAGWEYVEGSTLLADARRVAEEAVAKLKAPTVTPGKRDLVLHPSNLWLTIHESIGHPTELDRALGYEANFAGTSFATPDKLGKLKIGAPLLTFYADKTTPGGLATCGYDDDGVATQRWNLVDKGMLVGFQTTREQAGWIGERASRGTCYGDSYASFPFQRMPNVSLAPGDKERSFDDLVAGTDDGIAIVGRGSWSIDHQRLNFQFSGQTFWEIKGGKRRGMVKDVAYQANTLEFWASCDAIGGAKSWELHGSFGDGKGEPTQTNYVSHGCPPARFRKVNILDTNRRKP
ncbi:MAG TPA: TldD/PmbA family protein [Kofleriaceae bacterium]|nr:TldD/PmbA family protein [Kofleriaceae bacterium]